MSGVGEGEGEKGNFLTDGREKMGEREPLLLP